MLYLLLVPVVSLAILAVLVWRAPEGWEDESGFHLGQAPYQAGQAQQVQTGETRETPLLAHQSENCSKAA